MSNSVNFALVSLKPEFHHYNVTKTSRVVLPMFKFR